MAAGVFVALVPVYVKRNICPSFPSIIQCSGVRDTTKASMKLENMSAFGTGYLGRYKGIYSVYDAFYGLTAIYRHLNVSNRPEETV